MHMANGQQSRVMDSLAKYTDPTHNSFPSRKDVWNVR